MRSIAEHIGISGGVIRITMPSTCVSPSHASLFQASRPILTYPKKD